MGKGGLIFGGGFRVHVAIINLTSQLLFELLFTCRLKDVVSLVIFHLSF